MRTVGKVKWFDASTGEGCALSDSGTQAAFTRAALEPFGISAIEAGVALVYDVRIEAGRMIVGAIHEIAGQGPQPAGPVPLRVKGRVQWFDPMKGFGFVASKYIAGDILLHRSVLDAIGIESLREGAIVDCDVIQKLKGFQVTRIHAVLAPDEPLPPSSWGGGHILIGSTVDPDVIAKLENTKPRTLSQDLKWFRPPKGSGFIELVDHPAPCEYAVCKWFSRPKGFGFLVRVDGGADIFVHMDVLRLGGIRELRAGQRVRVRVRDTERGLLAAEVELDEDDED